MQRGDRVIQAAGIMGFVSLFFGLAGLVMAVLAAVKPMVLEKLPTAQLATQTDNLRYSWIVSTLFLGASVFAIVQVRKRRPLIAFDLMTRRWRASSGRLAALH